MGDPERQLVNLREFVNSLEDDISDRQRDIYILSGVLGGVDLFLIIAVILLIYAIFQVKKQLEDAEIEKQVEEEVNALKFAAYTGEEVHRKMVAASTPTAAPLTQVGGVRPESEYAFNAPFVDDRILPPTNNNKVGNGATKLNRY